MGDERARLRPLKTALAELALRIEVSVGPTGVVIHDTHPDSMPPDAIGLPGTLYRYRDRVRIVAGRFGAEHVRHSGSPGTARSCLSIARSVWLRCPANAPAAICSAARTPEGIRRAEPGRCHRDRGTDGDRLPHTASGSAATGTTPSVRLRREHIPELFSDRP